MLLVLLSFCTCLSLIFSNQFLEQKAEYKTRHQQDMSLHTEKRQE